MSPSTIPEISVVIPTLNEEENVVEIAHAIGRVLEGEGIQDYELIFIDNGSTDDTIERVRQLCVGDARIRMIVNARNFGQMRSPTHGIYQARGRAVIGLCADFQDPPELIATFIREWRAGYKIVLGARTSQDSSRSHRFVRSLGYGLLNRLGDHPIIPGVTGFGLYDRSVLEVVSSWNEPEPFFRAMLVETGLPLKTIPFHQPPRVRGESKNSLRVLASFVLSAFTTSSKQLVRLPLYLGTAMGIPALLFLPLSPLLAPRGQSLSWLTATFVTLCFALIFFFIGILGEQVMVVSARVRGGPLVVEKERINFQQSNAAGSTRGLARRAV